MLRRRLITKLLLLSMVSIPSIQCTSSMDLFDFTTMENLDGWIESSDTVRTPGKSKAVLTLQKSRIFQRAVFFTLLNPQPNGAGFAGVETVVTWNLLDYNNIQITCRGQGQNSHYKIVLRHKGMQTNDIGYEQFFTTPMSDDKFSVVSLPLTNFQAYYRGVKIDGEEALDTSNITMFGLQLYGGVYEAVKQSGVSALEVEKIKASN